MTRNVELVDDTPATCADCDGALGTDPIVVRDARRGRLPLCHDCGRAYLAIDVRLMTEDRRADVNSAQLRRAS